MKRIIASTLIIVTLIAVTFTGCGGNASSGNVKTGLGQVISVAKSKDATADKDGAAQADIVMAAVSVDSNGKIVSVTIDAAQPTVSFDTSGKIKSDLAEITKTKVEQGKDYGMIKNSKIGKEWYEQIADLEKWMIGKTIDQIKTMKVKEVDETHKNVPDEPDLVSKVTLTVEDFISVVEEAVKNAK